MLKVKMFIVKWLCKITNDKRWVHLWVDLFNEQIQRDLDEIRKEVSYVRN